MSKWEDARVHMNATKHYIWQVFLSEASPVAWRRGTFWGLSSRNPSEGKALRATWGPMERQAHCRVFTLAGLLPPWCCSSALAASCCLPRWLSIHCSQASQQAAASVLGCINPVCLVPAGDMSPGALHMLNWSQKERINISPPSLAVTVPGFTALSSS